MRPASYHQDLVGVPHRLLVGQCPMASISSFSSSGSTLAVASSRMMGASFIMARAMEMRQHVHAVRRDASQKEVMSLAMVDFPLPEGPTKALMAAAQGQDEVGEGVDQLAPTVPDVSHQVSCQPHITRSLTVGPFLRVVCMGILLCVSDGLTFVPSFAILRLEFANQT